MKSLFSLLLILGFTQLTLAGEVEFNGEKIDCDNAMTTYEMNACAAQSHNDVDKELNQVYQQLIVGIRKDNPEKSAANAHVALLRKAQRAWIAFRDAECELELLGEMGGREYSLNLSSCKESLTAKRVTELKSKIVELEM